MGRQWAEDGWAFVVGSHFDGPAFKAMNLKDMDKNCATKTKEFEENMKLRGQELVALGDTIKILKAKSQHIHFAMADCTRRILSMLLHALAERTE